MHVTILKGRVDRIFYEPAAITLYLMLDGDSRLHQLRVSDDAPFRIALMLTKPGDQVVIHELNGRIDKWHNFTMRPFTEVCP